MGLTNTEFKNKKQTIKDCKEGDGKKTEEKGIPLSFQVQRAPQG